MLFCNPPLLKELLPYQYLLDVSVVFFAIVLSLLVFILFYLMWHLNRTATKKHLVRLYSGVISEIILCDTGAECEAVLAQPYVQRLRKTWFSKDFGRAVLIGQLVNMHKAIAGQGAENIRWLYNYLELHRDSLQQLASKKWHRKAWAIQQLAEMRQEQYLTKLYKATNSRNKFVRNEAQVALVKLTGFKGLRFLNVVSQPISAWQQLCLLRELAPETSFDLEKIKTWMQAANESVVAFSLRLVKSQLIYELHDEVACCLSHPSPSIRLQALHTLTEIANEQTPFVVQQQFGAAAPDEKLAMLPLLKALGTREQLPFFRSLLHEKDARIKMADEALLQQWNEKRSPVYTRSHGGLKKFDVA